MFLEVYVNDSSDVKVFFLNFDIRYYELSKNGKFTIGKKNLYCQKHLVFMSPLANTVLNILSGGRSNTKIMIICEFLAIFLN